MEVNRHQRFTFSGFCFDIETRNLTRRGIRLHLTEQATVVLNALLERAGSIVTREELRHLLWPGGEFLDYDHSINKVVGQLRILFGDDRSKARFIETIPKHGYRFIAPVTVATMEHGAMGPPASRNTRQIMARCAEASPSAQAPTDREGYAQAGHGQRAKGNARIPRQFLKIIAVFCTVLVLLAGVSIYLSRRAESNSSTNVYLGIPPFEASGPGAAELAETFRLDLIDAVAELPATQMRAAHSFSAPLHDDASIRAQASSLHLDLLLLGKMDVNNGQCVLHLELVRGRDALHLASFHYSGSISELGTIRDRFQRDLFEHLRSTGSTNWRSQYKKPSPKAYEAYLQARYDLSQWSDDSVRKALKEFQDAIDEDPDFSRAYAGIASAYVVLAEHGAAPREQSYRMAQELAGKAVKIYPSIAEGHAILGQVALRQDWNFALAENEFRRAIEIDPNQSIYHLWLSVLLCDQSRFDECRKEIDLARSADPLWPPVYGTEVFLDESAGRYSMAVEAGEKLVALKPDWPPAYNQRGWAYWTIGRHIDAIADWRHMAQMENDAARIKLEDDGLKAFRRGGVPAYAQIRLNAIRSGHLFAHAATDFVPAEWLSFAGEYDAAIDELEKMVARHDPDVLQVAVNQAFLPLRKNPRFAAILMRVGLNQFPAHP